MKPKYGSAQLILPLSFKMCKLYIFYAPGTIQGFTSLTSIHIYSSSQSVPESQMCIHLLGWVPPGSLPKPKGKLYWSSLVIAIMPIPL